MAPKSSEIDEQPFRVGRRRLRHPSPTHAAALLGLLRAADRLERVLDGELRTRHGIGLHGFEVLLHLGAFSAEGELPMAQLTRQAPLSQSRVSRLVAELEGRGLVARTADERDTRAVRVAITEAGLALLREAQETHYDGLQRHLFSRLSGSEISQLATLTEKLLA